MSEMDNEIVAKIKRALIDAPITEAGVQHILALSRKLTEKIPRDDWGKYALLKFYCDWTVHSKIDRSEAGAEILARLHMVVAEHLKKSDNTNLVRDLSRTLSLDGVRNELNDLLRQFGAADVASQQKWREIVPILVEIISHVPLMISPKNKKLEALRRQMHSQPLKGTSVVEALAIVKVPSSTLNKSATANELTYCLMLTTSDTTRLVAPLILG
jgi:hypothetical protein